MTDAERIHELEDALITAISGDDGHLYQGDCPYQGSMTWDRDADCPACQRLERLIGHRRPAS